MPQTIKPATPLPWTKTDGHFQRVTGKDIDYFVHAANAYPRLVEALREAEKNFRYAAWLERNKKYAADLTAHADKCEYVLRELGGE